LEEGRKGKEKAKKKKKKEKNQKKLPENKSERQVIWCQELVPSSQKLAQNPLSVWVFSFFAHFF
jgi:hypothetical protein